MLPYQERFLKLIGGKRGRLMLMATTLSVISEGESKVTQLIYKVNTSLPVLDRILLICITSELIHQQSLKGQSGKRKTYHITQKGIDWLRCYNCLIGATLYNRR